MQTLVGPGTDGVQLELTQSHLDSMLLYLRRYVPVIPGPKELVMSHAGGDGGGTGMGESGSEVAAQVATVQTCAIPHSPDPRSTLTYP